jgi:hypothetical protein
MRRSVTYHKTRLRGYAALETRNSQPDIDSILADSLSRPDTGTISTLFIYLFIHMFMHFKQMLTIKVTSV